MIGWIRALANRLSSIPLVYEWIQRLAGQDLVYRKILGFWTADQREGVLDVGSSGGALTEKLAPRATCVDIDLEPLVRARRKRPRLRLVVASAASLPFRAKSFDRTVCVEVSHHLEGPVLAAAVEEFARVTRSSLLFVDAVRAPGWIPRLLWSLDRGAAPRAASELRAHLSLHFEFEKETEFRVLHEYVLWSARPKR
ncbi:MAG TPA: class I SAM-dependent methyltransferase [Thermoanaerobaculia bacterium]|nr:class I SAM-dependent methyltransferase [Thermoanaerobaculia bacterium]